MAPRKWMQRARERMEEKGTVGALHRQLHVPQGKTIPASKLETRRGDTAQTRMRKQYARNARKARD